MPENIDPANYDPARIFLTSSLARSRSGYSKSELSVYVMLPLISCYYVFLKGSRLANFSSTGCISSVPIAPETRMILSRRLSYPSPGNVNAALK